MTELIFAALAFRAVWTLPEGDPPPIAGEGCAWKELTEADPDWTWLGDMTTEDC